MSTVNFAFTFFRPHPQGHSWSFSPSHNQLPSINYQLHTPASDLSLPSCNFPCLQTFFFFFLAQWHLHSSTLSLCRPALPSIISTFTGTATVDGPTPHHGCGRAGPYGVVLEQLATHVTWGARSQWPKLASSPTIQTQIPGLQLAHSIIYHLWSAGVHEGIGPTGR